MKQKMKKLSAWCFGLSLVTFALNYVCFHFLTDAGFTTVWQPEPGKPWVTLLVAVLGVLFLFGSIMSLLIGSIFFGDETKE